MVVKHYVYRNIKHIKHNSFTNREGYDLGYIQEMIYNETGVVVDQDPIKRAVAEIRYKVKKYK